MQTAQETRGWAWDSAHFPTLVMPVAASFLLDTVGPGTESGFEKWSMPIARFRYSLIQGRAYQRMEMFSGPVYSPLAALDLVRRPPLSRYVDKDRALAFDQFVSQGGLEGCMDRWNQEWAHVAEHRLRWLGAFDPAKALASSLVGHLGALYEFMVWAWSVHSRLHIACHYLTENCEAAENHRRLLVEEPMGLVRRVTAEIGNRLAAERRLAGPGDVLLLTREEMIYALGGTGDMRGIVSVRRSQYEHYHRLRPPDYVAEGDRPPRLSGLPQSARQAMEAVLAQTAASVHKGAPLIWPDECCVAAASLQWLHSEAPTK